MKEIRNTTRQPLRVPLAGGKILHLGPGKTGQVSDESVERAPFQKLVKAKQIEVVGEGGGDAAEGDSGRPVHESTHGHQPPTVVLPKGNR